tara:strand:- start:233 stop:373 length:141 start_codon:yes stop_codon:yes gene_type:complete
METGELIPYIITMSIIISVLAALPVGIMLGLYIATRDTLKWWKDKK